MPFSGEDDHQTLVKVAKADWDFDDDCFDDLSHDAMEFIEGLLVKDPRCVIVILYTQRVRRKTKNQSHLYGTVSSAFTVVGYDGECIFTSA